MAISNKRKPRRDLAEENARLRKSVAERMAELDAANRQLAERNVQLEEETADRKRAEEALCESEARYRMLFDSMQDLFVLYETVYDDDGSVVDFSIREVNRVAEAATKTGKDQLVGKRLRERWPHMNPDHWEAMKKVAETGATVSLAAYGEVTGKFAQSHFWSPAKGLVATLSTDITEHKLAEEALRDRNTRLLALVETTSDFIWEMDARGVYTYCSPQLQLLWGFDPNEMLGKTPFDLLPPEDREYAVRAFSELTTSRTAFRNMQVRSRDAKGDLKLLEISGVPFFDAAGELKGYRGITRDITERKRAEDALRESEERFRAIVETAEEGIATHAPDGTITYVNQRMADMLGYAREELIGRSSLDFVDDRERQRVIRARESVKDRGSFNEERELQRKDGSTLWTLSNLSPRRDGAGGFVGYLAMHTDITKRKHAEEEVTRLAKFPSENPNPVLRLNFEGVILYANPASAPVLGHWGCAVGGAAPEFWRDVVVQARASQQNRVVDVELSDRVYSFSIVPVTDSNYVNLYGRDVTERNRAEESLRESEERFRTLANAIPQLAWIARADGYIYWYNQRWYDYTGTTPAQMAGWGWQSVHDPQVLPSVLERWKRSLASGEDFDMEFPLRGADGVFRPFLTRVMPLRDAGGTVMQWFGTNTDISERKRAEAALRESEERLRLAQHYSGVGVWDWWPQTGTEVLSDETNRLHGLAPGTVNSYGDWLSRVHPDDQAAMVAMRDKALEERKPFDLEFRILQPSGQTRWIASKGSGVYDEAGQLVRVLGINIDITARKQAEEALRQRTEELQTIMEAVPTAVFITRDADARTITGNRAARELVELPSGANVSKSAPEEERPTGWQEMRGGIPIAPEDLPMQQAARGKEIRDYAMDLVFRDGQVKSVVSHATPLRDELGNPCGGIAVLVDVTERKRAAERIRKLNSDLEQRAGELEVANEELEQLATTLALDLRSPLVSLRGVSRVLGQDYAAQLPPQARSLFHLIEANADEMEELTQGLLRLMHVTRQTLRKQELNPEDLVRAAWAELQPEREGRDVELTVGPLPTCQADLLLLKRVWVNLLSNALKATRQKEGACIQVGAFLEPKRTVYYVKDNGIGFDISYAGTIFRAFQRYHRAEEWEGSGVGLTIVDSIIRRHGGRTWAEGAENQGATFYFEV